jgi:hypothetical protein
MQLQHKNHLEVKVKGKFTTGNEGPGGEQNCSSSLSLTSVLDWDRWLTPRPGRFNPDKEPVPIVYEAVWATGPVWWGAENLAPLRDSIPGPSNP